MAKDPERPELALCMDMLAPEGYGEIIGGGQRIHQLEVLSDQIRAHGLPEEAFKWYVDLRRYGTVPMLVLVWALNVWFHGFVVWIMCGKPFFLECYTHCIPKVGSRSPRRFPLDC